MTHLDNSRSIRSFLFASRCCCRPACVTSLTEFCRKNNIQLPRCLPSTHTHTHTHSSHGSSQNREAELVGEGRGRESPQNRGATHHKNKTLAVSQLAI